MKAIKTHVAGVDVHKDILAITVLIGKADEDPKSEHFECSTMTDGTSSICPTFSRRYFSFKLNSQQMEVIGR